MNNLKKYSKPVIQMEQFVPQEYVADCWRCELYCSGTQHSPNGQPQVYIFDLPYTGGTYRTDQMVEHQRHLIGRYKVISDTDPGPEYFSGTLHEFTAACASVDAVSPGNQHFIEHKTDQYTSGWVWPSQPPHTEYVYCFAEVIEWQRISGSPNAS